MDDKAIDLSDVVAAIRARALTRPRQSVGGLSRAGRFVALVIGFAVQLGLLLWLARAMHFEFYESPDVLSVTLYSAPPTIPALPEPPPRNQPRTDPLSGATIAIAGAKSHSRGSMVDHHAETEKSEVGMHDQLPEVALFNSDGSIRIPNAGSLVSNEVKSTIAEAPFMQPLGKGLVRPNYFNNVWREPAHNLTLRNAIVKFVADKLNTSEQEFRLPWGTKVVCSSGLALSGSEKSSGENLPSSSEPTRVLLDLGGWCGFGYAPADGARPSEHWKPSIDLGAR
jgi:hypothetical protein